MPGWVINQSHCLTVNRKRRPSLLFAALLAITLLVFACNPATEIPPLPTAIPVDTATDLPQTKEPLSQYLKFGRLTAEDGLPNDQVWDVVQDSR